jgi:regulator of sigma E protease
VLPEASSLGIGAGSRVLAVDGKPVSSYAELDRAARAASGDSVNVDWSVDQLHAKSERQSTRMALRPEFEVLRDAQGDGVDQGLIGLAPLARVIEFASGSLNTETLKEGDVILRVGTGAATLEGPRTSQLMAHLRSHPNETLPAVVLRDGKETEVSIHTDREARAGVYLEPAWDIARVAQSVDAVRGAGSGDGALETPAKALAALPLATVLSLDGEPVEDFREFRGKLIARAKAAAAGQPLAVRVGMRDPSPEAQPHEATATLSADDVAALSALSSAFPIPETYFDPQFTVLSANGNPITAVSMGFHQTWVMVKQVFLTIDRVARGSVGADQLQGPVGILHTGTKVADEGFMYIVFFLALISVNLAVVNLLPIPIADGGLFLFLMYEKFAGRAPSIAFQNAAALTGIALVAGLFLFTFYNDIARLLH